MTPDVEGRLALRVPVGDDGLNTTFYSLLDQWVDHVPELMRAKRNRRH